MLFFFVSLNQKNLKFFSFQKHLLIFTWKYCAVLVFPKEDKVSVFTDFSLSS